MNIKDVLFETPVRIQCINPYGVKIMNNLTIDDLSYGKCTTNRHRKCLVCKQNSTYGACDDVEGWIRHYKEFGHEFEYSVITHRTKPLNISEENR